LEQDLLNLFEEHKLNTTLEQMPVNLNNLSDIGSEERLRNNQIDVLFRLERVNETSWSYAIIHQSTSEHSREAMSRILVQLNNWEDGVINATLIDAGLDPDTTLDPVQWDGDIDSADSSTKGEQAGMVLSMFIPMVIAIWTASSAIQPAIDMTAGERERGTLEALLSLPCSRMQLLAGKWLAVATITSTGVALQIGGLIFAITFLASSSIIGLPTISLLSALLLLGAVVIFAVMVVAFELALAMKAHSVKEAGSLLAPAIIFIMFPAIFTQVINLDGIESWWFAIPLVNILIAMRELLLDRVITEHVVIWLISSTIYAGIAAWYAAKQFKREDLIASIS
jgi:sodium transport system permease protein